MALQHVDRSASRQVFPEALARFAQDDARSSADPLRSISVVAICVDALVISLSVLVGFLARGNGQYPWKAALAILAVWVAVLAIRGAYDSSRIGVGSDEFKNVLTATVGTFAFFASVGFVLEITDGRKFIFGTFLAGAILLPLGRRTMRVWVFNQRRKGNLMRRTLVIGSGPSLLELEAGLSRDPRTGFKVVSEMRGPAAADSLDGWLDQVECSVGRVRG